MKLLKGDCLKLLPKLRSKSIDMILADLPYGTTHAKWDKIIAMQPLWKEYKRIIKNHGVIVLFGNEPFSSHLRLFGNKYVQYRYDWTWLKSDPTGFLNSHRMPLSITEDIMIFYKHLPTYNPQMRTGFKKYIVPGRSNTTTLYNDFKRTRNRRNNGTRFPINCIHFSNDHWQGRRLHPTQKPVPLLEYLIKTYTNQDDIILDNVMGSGSTGIACQNLHRKFIGMEINDKYFEIAKKRIEANKNN